jgi:hypothetical protein
MTRGWIEKKSHQQRTKWLFYSEEQKRKKREQKKETRQDTLYAIFSLTFPARARRRERERASLDGQGSKAIWERESSVWCACRRAALKY